MMRILDAQALRECLDMPACIEAMRAVFIEVAEGRFHTPLRSRVRPQGASANGLTLMPALRETAPRRWCLKEMVVTPANPTRGLDPLQGLVVLHDGDDGRVLAVADAPQLTTLRTAATSALATLTFARPGARTVAVIGAGVQGRSHLQAMRSILPDAELRLWGRSAAEGDTRWHRSSAAPWRRASKRRCATPTWSAPSPRPPTRSCRPAGSPPAATSTPSARARRRPARSSPR